nr:MAG TPA: hypothetical protein [Bacteriophage sp.]
MTGILDANKQLIHGVSAIGRKYTNLLICMRF